MLPRVALLLLAVAASRASAQEGFSSELERVADASREEKLAYVQASVAEIDDSFAAVDTMLEDAKAARDAAAVQCVASRHAALKALQAVSQQAEQDMAAALAAGQTERADHEFRKVAVAVQRTRMLHAEAERCVGGQELADGETNVQFIDQGEDVVFVDGGVDVADVDVGFDPPDVSPFR